MRIDQISAVTHRPHTHTYIYKKIIQTNFYIQILYSRKIITNKFIIFQYYYKHMILFYLW